MPEACAQQSAAPSKASQLADLEAQLKTGLISKTRCEAKKKVIESPPKEDATDSGPANLLQNAGFEEFNQNTPANHSRWPGWGGWCWGGDYEFFKATGNDKHSGEAALGCRCTGATGRIGITSPAVPITKKDGQFEFSIWIKGTGANKLRVAFESGASGGGEATGGSEWKQVTFSGKPDAGAKSFNVYIYIVGGGTIFLDDAVLREK